MEAWILRYLGQRLMIRNIEELIFSLFYKMCVLMLLTVKAGGDCFHIQQWTQQDTVFLAGVSLSEGTSGHAEDLPLKDM